MASHPPPPATPPSATTTSVTPSPSLVRSRSSSLVVTRPRAPSHSAESQQQDAHPPDLARPTALSLRPHLSASAHQTRIRARSVTSGHSHEGLQSALRDHLASHLHLSPTLPGSPVLPPFETFLDGALAAQHASSSPGFGHVPTSTVPTGDDSSSSTSSDAGRESETDGSLLSTAPSSDETDPAPAAAAFWPKHPAHKLDHASRIELRRGRSFTSLLMLPLASGHTPTLELDGPILEESSPAPSDDLESASSFPPLLSTHAAHPVAAPDGPRKTFRAFLPELGLVLALFLASFLVIFFLISTLPNLFIPHSLSSLPSLTSHLSTYAHEGPLEALHLFAVITALFLWKQCFSIPGSVLTNVLFGALYGTTMGTIWACLWTAVGSTGAYMIAKLVAPLVEHYFATPLALTRRSLQLTPSNPHPPELFSHLLLARLFPLLPYSVLNIISGTLALPLVPFFTTLVLGSFPFNFSTCSIGALVSLSITSQTPLGETLWSKEVIVKLVLVSVVSGVPVVFKDRLKKLVTGLGAGRGLGIGGGRVARTVRTGVARRKWNRSWVGPRGEREDEGGEIALA